MSTITAPKYQLTIIEQLFDSPPNQTIKTDIQHQNINPNYQIEAHHNSFKKLEQIMINYISDCLRSKYEIVNLETAPKTYFAVETSIQNLKHKLKMKLSIVPKNITTTSSKLLDYFIILILREFKVSEELFISYLDDKLTEEDHTEELNSVVAIINDFQKSMKWKIENYFDSQQLENSKPQDSNEITKTFNQENYRMLEILTITRIIIVKKLIAFILNLNVCMKTSSFEKQQNIHWNNLLSLYTCTQGQMKEIETVYTFRKSESKLNFSKADVFLTDLRRSRRLRALLSREAQFSAQGLQKGYIKQRHLKGKYLSHNQFNDLISNLTQIVEETDAKKSSHQNNPYYFCNDLLFKYQNGEITYKLSLNNNKTKIPSKVYLLGKEKRHVEFQWNTNFITQYINNIPILVDKLTNSGIKDQFLLSKVITQKMNLGTNLCMDPEMLYTNSFYNSLIIKDNNENAIQKIIDQDLKDDIFTYHVFEVRKDQTTNFQIERKQIKHGMSGELVNYLGYTLEEIQQKFLKSGFPIFYKDIQNTNEIQEQLERDIFDFETLHIKGMLNTNTEVPYRQKMMTLDNKQINVTLNPAKTYLNVIDQNHYYVIRTYKISREELNSQLMNVSQQYKEMINTQMIVKTRKMQQKKLKQSLHVILEIIHESTQESSNSSNSRKILMSSDSGKSSEFKRSRSSSQEGSQEAKQSNDGNVSNPSQSEEGEKGQIKKTEYNDFFSLEGCDFFTNFYYMQVIRESLTY